MQEELDLLRFQNSVMREKLWASNGKDRVSDYMFLVNTRYKPTSWTDFNDKEAFCDALMQDFTVAVQEGKIVTLNRKKHAWTTEFIDRIRVRYVVELGKGKMKKDGTRGQVGGYVHIHVRLTIYHRSNITLTWEALKQFFDPLCWREFAEHPFIGHPKLIPMDRVDEYYSKSFTQVQWKEINIDVN